MASTPCPFSVAARPFRMRGRGDAESPAGYEPPSYKRQRRATTAVCGSSGIAYGQGKKGAGRRQTLAMVAQITAWENSPRISPRNRGLRRM